MAKLGTPTTAGFNAGKTFYAKPMKISDIVIDPEIAGIFDISDSILEDIKQKIKKHGYNKEEPVVVWKGHNILVDGRTRYTAVRDLGEEEIPAVEREFESRAEAILYTLERQVLRRNLTGPEMVKAAGIILENGGGAQEIAKSLGVSRATAYQTISILKEAPEEIVQAVESGDISVKKGYTMTTKGNPKRPRKPDADETSKTSLAEVREAQPPDSASFLKGAVIMLVKAEEQKAAGLLVNHFLEKNEREEFYGLLPAEIREVLDNSTGGVYQ